MNPCIINFAKNYPQHQRHGSWYLEGQERLKRSLAMVGYAGGLMLFQDYPAGSPRHEDVQYAFKLACLKEAERAGYDVLLWIDCSVWAIRPIEPILDEIKQVGYVIFDDGWNVGQWCTDAALVTLGITREEAFTIPMLWSAIVGFDLTNERSRKFYDEWYRLSRDGITFKGPWSRDGLDTQDKRVLGHRHDQTAESVIAWRLGMTATKSDFVSRDINNMHPTSILRGQGNVRDGDLDMVVKQ